MPAGDPHRIAQDRADGVDVVDAMVLDFEARADGQPRPHVPGRIHANLDRRVDHLADPAFFDQTPRCAQALAPTQLLVDCQLDTTLARQAHDFGGVGQRIGQRLLAQQMLAGGDAGAGNVELVMRRDRDLADLDRRVGQQRLQAVVNLGNSKFGGHLFGSGPIDIIAGHDIQVVLLVGGQHRVLHDTAAANNANAVIGLGR